MFQRDAGLPATGRPDDALVARLHASSSNQATTYGRADTGDFSGSQTYGQPTIAPAGSLGRFSILEGFDIPYGDYRSGVTDPSMRGISPNQCESVCAADNRCRAFTYNANVQVCILKDSIGSKVPFAGAISGIKGAAKPDGAMAANPVPAGAGQVGAYPPFAPAPIAVPSGVRQVAPVKSGGRIVTGYPIEYGTHKGGDFKFERGHYIKSHFDLALYFDLALLKQWPKILEDQYVAYDYARRFLTGSLYSRYIAGCQRNCRRNIPYDGWQGQNEFEREASYRAFVSEIGPLLAKAAPDLPLQIVNIQEIQIHPYDSKKQVFPLKIVRPSPDFLATMHAAASFDLEHKGEVPAELPMARDKAEQFIARFPPDKRVVYVALEESLGEPHWGESLHRPTLTLQITGARLYADADGSDMLYDFTKNAKPVAINHQPLSGLPTANGRVLVRGSPGSWNFPPDEAVKKLGRLGLIMAISKNPDILDNDDLAFASLQLLSLPLQKQIVAAAGLNPEKVFDENNINYDYNGYWLSLDEFDKRALLRKIRSDVPPLLSAEAPELPVPVTILCKLELQEYDFDKQQFPIDRSVNTCSAMDMDVSTSAEADLFDARLVIGAPLETTYLPKAIRVPLDRAKEYKDHFIQNATKGSVFLGIEADLTSLVEMPKINSGRSRYFEFKIAIDQIDLFAKNNLNKPFGHLDLLPMPSVQTVRTTPGGPVQLDEDTLNLLMLSRGTVEFDAKSFSKWANYRAFAENFESPWAKFFPKDIAEALSYNRPVNPAIFKNFEAWNKARAEALPKTFYMDTRHEHFRHLASEQATYGGTVEIFQPVKSGDDDLAKRLAIPTDRLIRASDTSARFDLRQLVGIDKKTEIVFVLPAPRDEYTISLNREVPKDGSLAIVADLHVVNIQVDREKDNATLLIIDVEPVGASIIDPDHMDGSTFGSATFDKAFRKEEVSLSPQQKRADALKQLRERLNTADISGIRLGMSMAKADKLVRSAMDVAWAGKLDPFLTTREKFYDDFVGYFSKDGNQSFSLFYHPSQPDQLVAVARTIFLPERVPEEVLRQNLEEKYGPAEIYGGSGELVWTANLGRTITSDYKIGAEAPDDFRGGTCFATARSTWGVKSFRLGEGKKPEETMADAPQILLLDDSGAQGARELVNKPSSWKYCGVTITANIGSWGSGSRLTYAIFDLSAYGAMFPEPPSEDKTVKGPTVPKL